MIFGSWPLEKPPNIYINFTQTFTVFAQCHKIIHLQPYSKSLKVDRSQTIDLSPAKTVVKHNMKSGREIVENYVHCEAIEKEWRNMQTMLKSTVRIYST